MKIPFYKMHGAANDFILVDDREQTFPATDQTWLAEIMNRRTGIGSDGTILIQPSEQADFRMRFFNPDGGEVEMCGNGARCIARLAYDLGVAPCTMTIDTVAGILRAEKQDENILLYLTNPEGLTLNGEIELEGQTFPCHFANTGVPHVVIPVADVTALDIPTLGAAVRYHERFAPAGTNANFIEKVGADALKIRTYERGVEAETYACGTGISAGALTAALSGLVTSPTRVQALSGDWLTVGFVQNGDEITNVTLLGPAVHVFQGELEYTAR